MFQQILFAKTTITVAAAAVMIGFLVWRVYEAGERHAVQQQIVNDNKAQSKADDVRQRDRVADPDRLLQNDPFLRR